MLDEHAGSRSEVARHQKHALAQPQGVSAFKYGNNFHSGHVFHRVRTEASGSSGLRSADPRALGLGLR